MSMRFSICTKILVVVLIFAMLSCSLVYGHGDHSGSDPCWKERDDFWDEYFLMLILGGAAIGACQPSSLVTGGGIALCAAATLAFFAQQGEVEEARNELRACEREHES